MRSRQSSAILHQPHPRPAAPVYEPHSSRLQRPPEGRQDGATGVRNASLKLSNRHDPDLGGHGEVILGPVEQGAGGAALGWRHTVNLSQY
jgi:hypothetical protein